MAQNDDPYDASFRKLGARQRVQALLERTANTPWMRARFGSFETALVEGLRNLLAEADHDEETGRSSESLAAHYTFLYGLFSALHHLFFTLALQARLSDNARASGRAPDQNDAAMVLRELEVFHQASVRPSTQRRFFQLLTNSRADAEEIQEQAARYDAFNSTKKPGRA